MTLFIGEGVYAACLAGVFNERLLVEKPEGKTLHHLGNTVFAIPADTLNVKK